MLDVIQHAIVFTEGTDPPGAQLTKLVMRHRQHNSVIYTLFRFGDRSNTVFMLRFGWIGEKIVIGDDVHTMSFIKTDMPDASLKMDLERIECFLDVKANIEGMGSAKKRLDLDEFVSDNLETMNMRVLMKRIHGILTQVTAKPEGEGEGETDD